MLDIYILRHNINQTTKNIIENPSITGNELLGLPNIFLSVKYKGEELNVKDFMYSSTSGIKYGIKDEDEVFIGLNEHYIEDYAIQEFINVCFRFTNEDLQTKEIIIEVNENELFSEAIKKYRAAANDKRDKIMFIFNSKEINE